MFMDRSKVSQTGSYSFLGPFWRMYSPSTPVVLWVPMTMANSVAFPVQRSCCANFLPECGADFGDRLP